MDQVKVILLDAIGALDAPVPFSELLRLPLVQPGKLLGELGRPTWVLTTLAACAAAGGDSAIGARVAASVELFLASLDLIDEIEDGDYSLTVEAGGMPQALNAATALLFLAQQTLLQVPARNHLPQAADFIQVLTAGGLAATGGQYHDLASAGDTAILPDEALAIARQKAGALLGMACRLGAMVGTADASLLDLYALWGTHFGTAAQLYNDLNDAAHPDQKSDVERQKETMPLVFSRRSASDGESGDIAASGALHFTWVVLEIERQTCRDLIDQLAARRQDVAGLRELM